MVDLVRRFSVSRRQINSAYEDAASSLPTKAFSYLPSPGMNLLLLDHSPTESEHFMSLSRVRLLVTPWTAAYQAPPSMGFSRQEYWSGLPLPSPKGKWLVIISIKS